MRSQPTHQIRAQTDAVSDLDHGRKQATYVMSAPTPDSHGTLILSSAWERRIEAFRRNPTFIMSHNFTDREALLGRWVDVWIDQKRGLMGRAEYDLDHCALAREVWPMVEAGLIKAVSVGFRQYEFVLWDEPTGIGKLPPHAQKAFQEGEIWACYTDVQLRECSQVIIGSNPDALLQAINRSADADTRLMLTRSLDYGASLVAPVDKRHPVVRLLLDDPRLRELWAEAVEAEDDEWQDLVYGLAERDAVVNLLDNDPLFARAFLESTGPEDEQAIAEAAVEFVRHGRILT